MSIMKLKAGTPSAVTPAEFFSTVCPAVLGLQSDVCKKIGGTYAFELSGDGGGAWTLDYNHGVVVGGADNDTDLSVQMTARDFADMMKGTLDVIAAAVAGRIRVRGDTGLFSNLIAVLEPAGA